MRTCSWRKARENVREQVTFHIPALTSFATARLIDEPTLLSLEEWKHLELLHSSHSLLCSFVLQVGRRLLFCFFLEYTLLCKQTWNSCDTFLSGDTPCFQMPRIAHFSREIYKRRFYIENASDVFSPHYTGGIWRRNNYRSVCICVWGNLGQRNHVITVTSSASFSKCFPSTPERKVISISSVFVTD